MKGEHLTDVIQKLSEVPCPELHGGPHTATLHITDEDDAGVVASRVEHHTCPTCNGTSLKYNLTEDCPGEPSVGQGELYFSHDSEPLAKGSGGRRPPRRLWCCDGSRTRLVPAEVAAIRVLEAFKEFDGVENRPFGWLTLSAESGGYQTPTEAILLAAAEAEDIEIPTQVAP